MLMPLALLFCLVPAAPAHAVGGVKDGAGVFGREARLKADEAIEEIRRRTHKDLLIETVKKLPQEKLTEYRALKSQAERSRFFRDLAESRARHWDVDGVCVLLCRVPAEEPRRGPFDFLRRMTTDLVLTPQVVGQAVIVWPAANDAYFPEDDRRELEARFGKIGLPDHPADKVLLEAVKYAGDELEANARALGAPPINDFRWTDAVWAAAALAGAWAVLGALRARVAVRQGTPGPAPGASQAQAALYGTAAALWLFEAYRARRQGAAAAPAPPAAEPPAGDGAMHPDDLAALSRETGPWAAEDAEAATGRDSG
jgi:hypothetical protein